MGNFDINTNFNMLNNLSNLSGFNNSISDFNKAFNDSIKIDSQNLNFEDVMNSLSNDNIKNEAISPTAKMASDLGFSFRDGLTKLSDINKQAETDFETFASGGDISIHEVMISSQKSSLAMQMAIQLRNQMLNAYNEFKNMQL